MNLDSIIPIIILSAIGVIAVNIRAFGSFIIDRFINLFLKSVLIEESSEFYSVMQKYIITQKRNKIRNFYYRTFYDGNFYDETDLFYNVGLLPVKFEGSYIFIYKNKIELKNATFAWKTSKNEISVFSFNRDKLIRFCEYVDLNFGKDILKSYFNDKGTVSLLSTLEKKNFNNVFLNDRLEDKIKEDLDLFLKSKEQYELIGIKYKRVYLFHGPAGTGKSSLAIAIANYSKRPILSINKSKDMSDEMLISLIANRPKNSVILFEDIDCLFDDLNRDNKIGDKEKENSISLSCILNILDGAYTPNDCIFVLTTNCVDKLDAAIKRDGRSSVFLEITKPNEETKDRYVQYLKTMSPDFNPSKSSYTLAGIENQFLIHTLKH